MASLRRTCESLRCLACQRWLLSSFVPQLSPRNTPLRRQFPFVHQRRGLTTTRPLRSQDTPAEPADTTWVQGDTSSGAPVSSADSTKPDGYDATSDKPWYLQVQDAQFDQPTSIAARQQLPELPDAPPPLLEGVLHHLSVDIGLDYLSLVDLRTIDPPPALGTNLIMIFGTARSEKHLNVSADRFCRWLRTEHKVTPYADGLLGRNEFKLKMRRKLRRTKMLSAAGARDLSEPDDGISTGWVCVNVGTVNESTVAEEQLEGGAVGFGKRSDGTKLVVQMMTEDRRGELDLEGLWTGVLKTSLKRQNEISSARSSSQLREPARSSHTQEDVPTTARFLSQSPPSELQQEL